MSIRLDRGASVAPNSTRCLETGAGGDSAEESAAASGAAYCGAQTRLTCLCSAIYVILPAEKRPAGMVQLSAQQQAANRPERHSPYGQEFRGYAEVREG